MTISNNKTSHLVSSQVPGFVREDHPVFVEFLESYYKFLEQEQGAINQSKNFTSYLDIDTASDQFAQLFYAQYLKMLPKGSIADKNIVLKHAKDFYRSKGTEKSIKFLARVMFNKEATLYYPKKDILKASDGKWFIEKSLRVTDIARDNVRNAQTAIFFSNTEIRGKTSNAYATVEKVEFYYDGGSYVTELKLSNVYRDFTNGEEIFAYYTEEGVDRYLTANLFLGIGRAVIITNVGSGYTEGTYPPVERTSGNTGNNAQVIISKVSKGGVKGIAVINSGAGFQTNDSVLITSDIGFDANAKVYAIDNSGTTHPNSYNIVASIIALESNTMIGNTIYSNLSSTNANVSIANAVSYWTYANCGPIVSCVVLEPGTGYNKFPKADVIANTTIRSLGILGRISIVDGGLGYASNDKIEFLNSNGSFGTGAYANVVNVDANGTITSIAFEALPGFLPGGSGYLHDNLPSANVITSTGNGAIISVDAILGDGENLLTFSDTIGSIREMKILNPGAGYITEPKINLASYGDGTAQAYMSIFSGVYTRPGRYINDDGHLSSYNFLQNKDYYQNYSYVVKIDESVNKYRQALRDLTHPAGMKLFGEYIFIDEQTQQFQNTIAVVNTAINVT